jgi:hypothetical protein
LVQALPQLAQFEGVPSWVSQPAAAVQSSKPLAQAVSVHAPVLQDASAFGKAQETLHAPQSVKVRMSRSQPLSGIPSQSLKPGSHVGEQPPAVQAVVPCALLHDSPQAVQFDKVPS